MPEVRQQLSFDMASDTEKLKNTPLDDVDFSSGFETQYEKEYSPLEVVHVQPPDAQLAWYRDFQTILMVGFLVAVLLLGSVLLITLVFTGNPFMIFLIVAIYLCIAAAMICLEVKSIHVR